MEDEERPQFNFKQYIPRRFGRVYVVRMIVYILGFAIALGFLINKWKAADANKNNFKVLDQTQNKEIDVEVNP